MEKETELYIPARSISVLSAGEGDLNVSVIRPSREPDNLCSRKEKSVELERKQGTMDVHPKQGKCSMLSKEVKPIIIDLDTYEEVAPTASKGESLKEDESFDTSMALVVVEATPEEICDGGHDAQMAGRRLNDRTNAEPSWHSGAVDECARYGLDVARFGLIAEAERLRTGNGKSTSRSGAWDGPPRWSSSPIGILTVQCARCLKWRVVPTREQYEAIREHILEQPWVCENALQWRPDAHCDFPTDLNPDSKMLWAIDKPNLPSSPPGWQRKVIVRKDSSTKFADVYYTAPGGKSLRSMVEIAKYLEENPQSVPQGTNMSQFSFTIPQPLPGVWAAKKRTTVKSTGNPSSSESNGKRARAPQPLAKQLAQRLLHGSNPPLLPIPPPVPLAYAQPLFTQPLAMQVPSTPPCGHFSNLPAVPSPSQPFPQVRNPYPHSFVVVGNHTPNLQQGFHSSQRVVLNSSSGQPESGSTTSVSMRKREQQKSRLGVVSSLSQNVKLPGILPLRSEWFQSSSNSSVNLSL